MHQQNSNSVGDIDREISQFYINKLENLEKSIQILIHELKIPLNYIFPSDFEEKYEKGKTCYQIDSNWIENHKEVIAFIIEGQINTNLMRLSEKFRHEFGGQTTFWMDLICDFAQNQKYDDNLRIWQVNDIYKNSLHLQKGEYEKNRKFRRLVKPDIQASKKLISGIKQLKNILQRQNGEQKNIEEILCKLSAIYSQYEDTNRKLVEFLKSDEQRNFNLDFFQPNQTIFKEKKSHSSSYSSSRTKKTQRQKERQNNLLKQRMITDFSVQLGEDKNYTLLKKIVGSKKQDSTLQWQEKRNQVDKIAKNLSQNNEPIQKLRQQLAEMKSKLLRKPQQSYANVCISYSYFSYTDFYIPVELSYEFNYSNPFFQYPDVNYFNNDYQQYEEFQADQLGEGYHETDDQTDDESLDTQEKREIYQQANPYQMDSEDQEVFVKAIRKDSLFFGKAWILDFRKQQPLQFVKDNSNKQGNITSEMIEQFMNESTALCLFSHSMPIAIPEENEIDEIQIQKLKQIVHMKSYNQIFQIIEESQSLSNQFSKQKVHSFLRKMTKKVSRKVQGKRANLYCVLDKQSKLTKIHPNTTIEQSVENSQKQQLQRDTSLNQPMKYHQNDQLKSKTKILQNSQDQNQQFSKKSQSISQSLSNKKSFIKSNRNRTELNASQSQSDVSETLSIRLRARSTKPVYNLDSIFGRKSRKKKDDADFQI